MNKLAFLVLSFALILASCVPPAEETNATAPDIKIGKNLAGLDAAVSCAHREAAKIGAEVLVSGGNAVDASIAVQWALAVCYPIAGNLGGGGFMILRTSDGKTETLDFREKAPLNAYETMFLDSAGNVIANMSRASHLASGVPGTVAGLFDAHTKYGKLPMKELIAPAIKLARDGFVLSDAQAGRFNEFTSDFNQNNNWDIPFVRNDRRWKEGDTLKQEMLANTLERINTNGPAEFYSGFTSKLILTEMADGNGMINAEDLENYQTIWREPVKSQLKNFTLISMPPPSSGGIAIAQLAAYWNSLDSVFPAHNSADYIHALTEFERRVYADRSEYLGDPDFYKVPFKELLDPKYLESRIEKIDFNRATPSSEIKPGELSFFAESDETTHLSVVDEDGMAVSVTTTINGAYGNKIVVEGGGFFLNNEMDDFSSKPGEPNMFGLIGGLANSIAPGKRMLSSMTPTIVEKDGELFMVTGSPGGSTIITTVFQTIANATIYEMNLAEAISTPRFHHQWYPDEIVLEDGSFSDSTLQTLKDKGHSLRFVEALGKADAILVNKNGTLDATGDKRGEDQAAGY
ncbi:MAG: gamma-glutamyltransferase [Cryomorphaceae bacterium]